MSLHRSRSRGAFTLVEVLLATVLAAMLLVALWSMLSMYSKVFEGGYARTEQAQLARTLLEQLHVDLQSTRQTRQPPARSLSSVAPGGPFGFPPPAGGPPGSPSANPPANDRPQQKPPSSSPSAPAATSGGSSTAAALRPPAPVEGPRPSGTQFASTPQSSAPFPVSSALPLSDSAAGGTAVSTTSLRPAGLFGTDSFLQIDVWQPAMTAPAYEFVDVREPGTPVPSHVDELKTVSYSFEELRDPADPSGPPVYYLLRREMSWEEAHPGQRSAVQRSSTSASSAMESTVADRGSSSSLPSEELDLERLMEDESTTVVPEVLSFALQYFDGAEWSEEWDSMARGGLPMAVEVTMQLRSHDEPEEDDDPALDAGVDYEKLRAWKHPEFRLLIPIAAAQPTGQMSTGSSLPETLSSGPLSDSPQSPTLNNLNKGGAFDASGNE